MTGLATSLILAAAGVAFAQEGTVAPTQPAHPVAAPVAVYGDDIPADAAAPKQGRVRTFLNKHGLGCAGNHEWFGCGSCRSYTTFMFGSCRTFFGEPCFPKEPRQRVGVLGSARDGCAGCGRD
jgi:hypothetical protein